MNCSSESLLKKVFDISQFFLVLQSGQFSSIRIKREILEITRPSQMHSMKVQVPTCPYAVVSNPFFWIFFVRFFSTSSK